jgi:hypothetical protein
VAFRVLGFIIIPALATSPSKTSDFRPGRSSVVSSRPLIGRHRRIEASSSDVVEMAKKEENKGRDANFDKAKTPITVP